ncbi:MAG: endonuclease [Anaeroplasmataceae bacterium]|nr:endonuclease [Anaeroplasmataceae bacterium]
MKRLLKFIACILFCLTITACTKEPIKEYKVSFYSDNEEYFSIKVETNGNIKEPLEPVKSGFVFDGWYKDQDYNISFDFTNESITQDLILYAKWIKESQEEFMEYYSSMNSHLDETFKITLHKLLKNTHKTTLSYTPGVWDALKKADEDPQNKENIICIYTGRSIPKANQDKGSSGNNIWNREHMWPNSHGFKSQDYAAYTDAHHLFASEKNINATRGNKDFNYVKNGNSDSYGNRWDSTFFEPRDEVKGDIARAMFYMVVRYSDPNELVLNLVNSTTSSSSNKTGQLGYLNVLLEWHQIDPVSDKEKERNEIIYSLQGNRNPFIDYPDWVNLLYPKN